MGLAGEADPGTSKRKEHLTKAIEFIDNAFDGLFSSFVFSTPTKSLIPFLSQAHVFYATSY